MRRGSPSRDPVPAPASGSADCPEQPPVSTPCACSVPWPRTTTAEPPTRTVRAEPFQADGTGEPPAHQRTASPTSYRAELPLRAVGLPPGDGYSITGGRSVKGKRAALGSRARASAPARAGVSGRRPTRSPPCGGEDTPRKRLPPADYAREDSNLRPAVRETACLPYRTRAYERPWRCTGRGFAGAWNPGAGACCCAGRLRAGGAGAAVNQVRLQLFALAYNLGNFLRRLALPRALKHWSFTAPREKLVKIGAKVVHHARYVIFRMAEVAVPKKLFRMILERIRRLRLPETVPR